MLSEHWYYADECACHQAYTIVNLVACGYGLWSSDLWRAPTGGGPDWAPFLAVQWQSAQARSVRMLSRIGLRDSIAEIAVGAQTLRKATV